MSCMQLVAIFTNLTTFRSCKIFNVLFQNQMTFFVLPSFLLISEIWKYNISFLRVLRFSPPIKLTAMI